jgi:hypothetical protein
VTISVRKDFLSVTQDFGNAGEEISLTENFFNESTRIIGLFAVRRSLPDLLCPRKAKHGLLR